MEEKISKMENMKPVKCAAFLVVRNAEGKILIIKRPKEDSDDPDFWGLPASMLKEDETYEQAIIRVGKKKLGVSLKVGRFIGRGSLDRGDYILHGDEYEAEIISGEPELGKVEGTSYVDWKWGTIEDLIPVAKSNSLCVNILLKTLGRETYLPIF